MRLLWAAFVNCLHLTVAAVIKATTAVSVGTQSIGSEADTGVLRATSRGRNTQDDESDGEFGFRSSNEDPSFLEFRHRWWSPIEPSSVTLEFGFMTANNADDFLFHLEYLEPFPLHEMAPHVTGVIRKGMLRVNYVIGNFTGHVTMGQQGASNRVTLRFVKTSIDHSIRYSAGYHILCPSLSDSHER